MTATENPGTLTGVTGAGKAIHANAESLSKIAETGAKDTSKILDCIAFCATDRLQMLYLRRIHGLTEAQAQAMAILIWGMDNG